METGAYESGTHCGLGYRRSVPVASPAYLASGSDNNPPPAELVAQLPKVDSGCASQRNMAVMVKGHSDLV